MNIKKVMSLMAVSSMLVACGGGTGGSSATELKDGGIQLKLDLSGPLTGETSTYGIPVKNTIELAIEDYNNSDDAKYKVELLAEDLEGNRCCKCL